jgi:hypothetical protein
LHQQQNFAGLQKGRTVSQAFGSILNPMAPEALAVTLGRRAFLGEIGVAVLLSLVAPVVCLLGVYASSFGANLLAVLIGTITAVAIFAVPTLWYASFRMNAASLARERAVTGREGQKIHPTMSATLFLGRSMVAGSIRSRILSGLPITLGGILAFAVLAYVTTGSVFMPLLHVLLGVGLLVEICVASELLFRQPQLPERLSADHP